MGAAGYVLLLLEDLLYGTCHCDEFGAGWCSQRLG